jgi:intermediate peptidase
LLLLDSISNEVCSVIDVAELCRNVHEDPAFRQAAESAFSELSAYIHELNTDATLYRSLMTLVDDSTVWKSLTGEQRRVAEDLRKEFEADGIHRQGTEAAGYVFILSHVISSFPCLFVMLLSLV